MRAEGFATGGLVLREAGRHTEAHEAYERPLELYGRKGAVPAAERVRAELETRPG
jgi:hypothetical protein